MNKQLLPLLLIAIVTAGAAFFLLKDSQVQTDEKGKLFEGLREQAEQISEIKLLAATGSLFSAKHVDNRWMAEVDGIWYPADQEKLSELVNQLADSQLHEAKTSKAENYARLGLMSLSQADSQATQVELLAGGKDYRVLIGNTATSGVGSYVRLPSQAQTWLIDEVIQLPVEQADWLLQPIFDFDAKQVLRVQLDAEPSWTIAQDADNEGAFMLASQPEGRELRYGSILDSLVNNLVELRFDGLLQPEHPVWQLASNIRQLTVTLENHTITIHLADMDGEYFLKATSNGTSEAHWQTVTYKISNFSYNQLNKQMEDFLQPLENAEEQLPPVAIDEGEAPGR